MKSRLVLVVLAIATLMGPASTSAAVRVSLDWSDCSARSTVECASLEVPLDRLAADPYSRTLHLPVRRVRATLPTERIGTLVTIGGGPGQRGTDWVVAGLHTPLLHERFDVVSWDPRGTSGDSLIDCIPDWDPFGGLDRSPDDPGERAALDRRTAELAEGCLAAHADLLPYLGTTETARDLELLRQALGEDRISLMGTSYGSEVALTYATLYPERVRAVVLDGYSDPNISPTDLQLEQATAFEQQLDGLLADCAADPTCPLGRDRSPTDALDALLAGLDAEPIEAGGDSRQLSQSDAYEAIVGSLLRDDAARQRLLAGLAAAADGDGAPLAAIAEGTRRGYEASGLTLGTFAAIECADDGPYWERQTIDDVGDLTARVHDAAARLGPWLWSPPLDPDLPAVGLCAMAPFYVIDDIGPIDAGNAGPVLVLTSTGDPTTPTSGAERSHDDLDEAVVLRLEADHHLAYHVALGRPDEPHYACVLDAVEHYLIDLGSPPAGHICE